MKPELKRWIISLLIPILVVIFTAIGNMIDMYGNTTWYIWPPFLEGSMQQLFWTIIPILVGFCLIPIGNLLAALFISIYVKSAQKNPSIQKIGFAKFKDSPKLMRKRFLVRLIFMVLLCVNIWVLFFQYGVFKLMVNPIYYDRMYDQLGTMLNFPMVPWYWIPIAVSSIVFTIAFVILDSGLVFVKKIPEHPEFSDTERVGDLFWNLIKGYAGISVIINFITLLSSPFGREGSLVIYPLLAATYLVFIIFSIDLFKNWGRRMIFNAVKKVFKTEIIALDFKITELNNPEELSE